MIIGVDIIHNQKQGPASLRIQKKILEYLNKHPFITFNEIYRKGNITKNWNDLHQNFLELKKAGQIKFLSFMKKYYKEPLPKEIENYVLILEDSEEIFTLIRNDINGIERKFLQEFAEFQGLDNISHVHKSRIKKSPMNYNYGIDSSPYTEQMFSKFFKLLMIECHNFEIDMRLPKLKRSSPRPLFLPHDHLFCKGRGINSIIIIHE